MATATTPTAKTPRRRGSGVVFWAIQVLLAPMLLTFLAGVLTAARGLPSARAALRYGGLVAIPALALAIVMVVAVSFADGLLSRARLRLAWAEIAIDLGLLAAVIYLAKAVLPIG